jgi:virulence-associated protein VagC
MIIDFESLDMFSNDFMEVREQPEQQERDEF